MTRFRLLRLIAAGALLPLFLLPACYPGGPQDLGDIGVVLTWHDEGADYSGLSTYGIVDEVEDLSNPDDSGSDPISPIDAIIILDEVNKQMVEAGFVLEPEPENNEPDVYVLVGATTNDAYVAFQQWYGYPDYWGGGWGYPGTGYVQFREGTIVLEMVDLRNLNNDGGLPDVTSLWYAGINGALTGGGTDPEADIRKGIDQSFKQSSYLEASGGSK